MIQNYRALKILVDTLGFHLKALSISQVAESFCQKESLQQTRLVIFFDVLATQIHQRQARSCCCTKQRHSQPVVSQHLNSDPKQKTNLGSPALHAHTAHV